MGWQTLAILYKEQSIHLTNINLDINNYLCYVIFLCPLITNNYLGGIMIDHDYDFDEARKPCGTNESYGAQTSGQCIKNAKEYCRWYEMCDLPCKAPSKKPAKAKSFTRPKRQTNVRIHTRGSQFFEKQDAIKRKRDEK